MRSLCVAEAYPWPCDDGYKLRLANTIEALRLLGEVDFLCMDGSGRHRDQAPDGVRVFSTPEGPLLRASHWVPLWVSGSEPRRLLRRDFSVARRDAGDLVEPSYDVVVFSHLEAWRAARGATVGPAVLDFDNLEDLALQGIRRLDRTPRPGSRRIEALAHRARRLVTDVVNRIDEGRWRTVQHAAAADVALVLVCSELDVERSGCANAAVMPNGYTLAWEPADHRVVADPSAPVFMFVGLLGYPPNIDAARWFATEVLPIVRRSVPGARFRIVGRAAESVVDLGSLPGVTVVGEVDSLQGELAAADVAIVPIRTGAGTRLKVVEAMANRLPMVSTSIGCEGIDVVDGEHLLIADGAEAFAAACVRIVGDEALRASLVDAAERRYLERYTWSAIREATAARLRTVAAAGVSKRPAP